MALVNYSDLMKASSSGGGSTWHDGEGIPSNTLGEDGDWYLDSLTGNYYQKVSGTYILEGNLKGPAGDDGPPGPAGADGAPGPAGPAGQDGQDANLFYTIEDVESTGTNRVSGDQLVVNDADTGKILLLNSVDPTNRTVILPSGLMLGWNCFIRNVGGGPIIIDPGTNSVDGSSIDLQVDDPKRYTTIVHEGGNKYFTAGNVTKI